LPASRGAGAPDPRVKPRDDIRLNPMESDKSVLRVYAIPVSYYCAKLRIVLRHKNLAWEEMAPPGGYGSAEYKTHVPTGNLPALLDGDLLIADSEAIAEYLEETRPNPPLMPKAAAARAKARELGRFHDTRLEPALRRLFPYLRGGAPADLIARQESEIAARLGQLAQLAGQAGPLSLGDCGFPIAFAWLDAMAPLMGFKLDYPAPVRAYRERLEQAPAILAELADYRPKLDAYLA